MAHAGQEIRFGKIGLFRHGHRVMERELDLFAHRIVGADQQVADDAAVIVAQRGDRNDRRKAAAVLADIGQLVDVLDAARRLEDQCFEPGSDRRRELGAQGLRARRHFLGIVDVAGADLVDDLGGLITEHSLGTDIEQLDDALFVGGDDREIGAGQNRVLQGSRLEQGFLAQTFDDTIRFAGVIQKEGIASFFEHVRPSCQA
jgi:hypothetical protein